MSTPSFSTIDRWLFEWKEGNLSPQQIEQLELFILLNPELEVDKEMWDLSHVQRSKVSYPKANELKRKRRALPILLRGSVAAVFLLTLWMSYLFFGSDSANLNLRLSTKDSPKYKRTFISKSVKKVNQEVTYDEVNKLKSDKQQMINKQIAAVHFDSIAQLDEKLIREGYVHQSKLPTGVKQEPSQFISETGVQADKDSQSSINLSIVDHLLQVDSISVTENANAFVSLEELSVKENLNHESKSIQLVQSEQLKSSVKRNQKMDLSLDMRWRKFSRTVKRMVDNPIALKNVKDPIFLLPGMQPMDVNFGMAGKLLTTRVQANSRLQWLNRNNEQFQSQLAIDGYSYAARGGVGLQINHNYYEEGKMQHSSAALIYSPKLSLTRNIMLEPSIRFKMGNKSLNSSQMTLGQTFEVERDIVQQLTTDNFPTGNSLWYRDIGAGLQLNTKWFYIGGQLDNFAKHYDNMFSSSDDKLERSTLHSVVTVGTEYESVRKTMSISPYIIYQKKGTFEETWFGTQLRYHWLTAGLAVSDRFEPAASIGLKFKHLMVLYCADYLQSLQLNSSSFSHQLTLRITTKPSRYAQRLLNQL